MGCDNAQNSGLKGRQKSANLHYASIASSELRPFDLQYKESEPLITLDVQDRLYPYLANAFGGQGSYAIKVGGVADHVHVLFHLSKNHALSSVIGSIKGESSKWLKTAYPTLQSFAWQGGYGAFSVSASNVESVVAYIGAQVEHHRRRDFKDEFRAFPRKYEVEFDERYVWD